MIASKELLYQHVKFLTTLRPFRNYQNLESLDKVCRYLIGEFDKYGLQGGEQTFDAEGSEYKNIIASYNPEKRKRMIVGAHYDVCGDQPGADDNASAVAGLLETARMVAEANPNIDYRIDFVSFCLEEPPFYATEKMGSYAHAESISEFKADVIGLINFEMIWSFTSRATAASEKPWTGCRDILPSTCPLRKSPAHPDTAPEHPPPIILCESAIDAISCFALHPGHRCISTSGARSNPSWLAPLIDQSRGRPIHCGFDADATGERMARAMIAFHPEVKRLRPARHDWNDLLKSKAQT